MRSKNTYQGGTLHVFGSPACEFFLILNSFESVIEEVRLTEDKVKWSAGEEF